MNTPEPSEEWLRRLVEELNRTPAGGWAAVARRHAADDPARLAGVLETAALLAAEKAAAHTGAEAAAWRAVVEGLAVEFPDHADAVRECAGLLTAVAGGRRPAAPAGDHRLRTGDRLGPFVVTGFVAGGGMGEVYAAAQDGLDRTVALKVIRAGSAGPLARARFERERLVLARLHQSNIVPVYFAGEAGDLQYYAMQYVPGAPLNRVVTAVFQRATTAPKTAQTPPLSEVVGSLLKERAAPPPPSEPEPADKTQVATHSGPAWRVAGPSPGPVRLSAGYFRSAAAALAQVAEAIQHGHDTGFLHRDIKPSNLILDARGVCMVIDYGLARACGAAPLGPPDDPVESALTRGGVGTPQYMAPEQFAGTADARSDVWGLGATLYELLTLRPAFAPGKWSDLERHVRIEHPPAADAVVSSVPKDLAAVCAKALAKSPADRYQTAGEFAADLRRWLGWKPTTARPGWRTLRPLRLWARRHKGAAAAVLLAAASLLTTAAAVTATARAEEADANTRTAVANAVAEAATAQAQEARRARDFAAALAEAEGVRRQRPFAGWADAVRAGLDKARRINPDAPLADAYAATLMGLDARRVRMYSHPEGRGPTPAGFRWVAFGPDGKLACGGLGATRGAVFDPDADRDPVFTTRPGSGPVAFADAATPLQLMSLPGPKPALVLWNLASNQSVAELPLPPGPVLAASMSLAADGRRAAAALTRPPDKDGKKTGVTVAWAVDPKAPGGAPKELKRWDGPATALAFSPDGRFLAAGTEEGTVTVRDAATGAEVAALTAGRVPVLSLAFGRNARADATGRPAPAGPDVLLAAGTGSGVVVWDLGAKATVSVCRGTSHFVNALAFTPDGSALVTVGHGPPLVFDVATGQALFELVVQREGEWAETYTTGVAVSADGRRVAVAGTNINQSAARLQVYEFAPDRGVGVYRGLAARCLQTWASPSADLVAGLSDEWQLGVWERATGRLRRVWDLPVGWTTDNADVAFDEVAGAVYFAANKAAVRLNLTTGAREQVWPLTKGLNESLLVRPGRPPLLARRELTAPDTEFPTRPLTLRCRELLPDGATRETFPGFVPDSAGDPRPTLVAGGKYLVLHGQPVGEKHSIHVYEVATGREVPVTAPPDVRLEALCRVSADGTRLAATVTLADRRGGIGHFRFPEMTLTRVDADFPVNVVDDAGVLGAIHIVKDRPGVYVFRAGRREPVVTFEAGQMPGILRMTPDGRFLHWGREDGSVRVADLPRALERLAALTGR